MNEWHLTILVVTSAIGAWLFAWKEGAMIVAGKDLNHFLLTVFRFMLAMLVLTPLLPRPVEIPTLVMCLLMMMGVFAPAHRMMLNARRMDLGHRIEWCHLGKGPYDSLTSFLTPWPKTRFLALCWIELLIAAAMYHQLNSQ